MRIFPPIAAAALAVVMTASGAMADGVDQSGGGPATAFAGPFDLAINVIAPTPAAVNGYLASLPEATRDAIISSCSSYVADPDSPRSAQTVQFCSIAAPANHPALPHVVG